MQAKKSLLLAAAFLGVAFAFLWPALENRGPFYTPDTRTYIRTADTAMHKLTGIATVWTASDAPAPASGSEPAAAPNADLALHNLGEARTRSLAEISKKGILLGRSPYYGMLLYTGVADGVFLLPMLVQALLVLLAAGLLLRALGIRIWPHLAWVGLALCVTSTAPFFCCLLMPDLAAGLAVLACAVLLVAGGRLPRAEHLAWYLLLSFALLCHDSCLLIVFSMLALSVAANLIAYLRKRGPAWSNLRGLAVILLALATAYVGQSLAAYGAGKVAGHPALRLPYLSARLIDDGPGSSYLHAHCPQSGFALCAYVDEFPLTASEFLFSTQPGHTVFELAPYETRRAISQEQVRFLLAVVRYDPWGVTRAAVRNGIKQLLDFQLSEFSYDPDTRDVMNRTYPLPIAKQIQASAAYRDAMPTALYSAILYFFVVAALGWSAFALRGSEPVRSALRGIFLWICAGILINAFVCGALSGSFSRYQARVVWLLPLVAIVSLIERYQRRLRLR